MENIINRKKATEDTLKQLLTFLEEESGMTVFEVVIKRVIKREQIAKANKQKIDRVIIRMEL